MRSFGTVFLLLLLSLIGFGFLLSYSYQLYQRMAEQEVLLESLQADLDALEVQYQEVLADRDRLSQQISDINAVNADLLNQLQVLKNDREALLRQMKTLQMRVTLMEKANAFLGWLEPRLAGSLAAVLVMPLVPVSLGVVYVMTRHIDTRPVNLPMGREHFPEAFQATLTRDEFHYLARYRRSRHLVLPSVKSPEDAVASSVVSRRT